MVQCMKRSGDDPGSWLEAFRLVDLVVVQRILVGCRKRFDHSVTVDCKTAGYAKRNRPADLDTSLANGVISHAMLGLQLLRAGTDFKDGSDLEG